MKIAWDKPLRDKAKAESKALWAIGYRGRKGSADAWGAIDDDKAWALFHFVVKVYHGDDPAKAFAASGLAAMSVPAPTGDPA